MKALLLVGGVAALGLGVYFATRKKAEAADPVYTQPAPINPEDVGMEPPEATPAPPVLAPPDEENVNVRTFDASKYRLQRGLGLVGRVRISRMPF